MFVEFAPVISFFYIAASIIVIFFTVVSILWLSCESDNQPLFRAPRIIIAVDILFKRGPRSSNVYSNIISEYVIIENYVEI